MSVSWRHTLFATVGAVTIAGVAIAGPGGQVVNTPSVNVGGQNGSSASGCCNVPNNHIVNVPGVNVAGANVVVGGSNVASGASTLSVTGGSTLSVNSGGSPGVFYRDSFGYPAPQPYESSVLNNLNVDGANELVTKTITEQVPHTEEVCVDPAPGATAMRAVQAVCIDDRGTPHPASQTFAHETVDASYSGEVFRCMAGTSMQVTYGQVVNGTPSFEVGQTIACSKGEALTHKPGGQLACAPQAPQRNCNERSLLRRHGPGVKFVEGGKSACVPTTRTVMKSVSRQVQVEAPASTGRIILDGGVGQGVY